MVFVDRDRAVAAGLVRTAAALGVEHQVRVMSSTAANAVTELVARGEKFGIIFLDPPYRSGSIPEVICDPLFPRLVDSEGLFIVEREAQAEASPIPSMFRRRFQRKYGGTIVEIFDRDTADV